MFPPSLACWRSELAASSAEYRQQSLLFPDICKELSGQEGERREKDEALALGQMENSEDGRGGGESRQTQAFHSDPCEA